MIHNAFLSLLAADRTRDPWYDNAWLIGIVTGLASGVLLAAATQIFIRMRRARKRPVEERRPRPAEELPILAPPSSSGPAIFGSPLHQGSGDINQSAGDIHTYQAPMPSERVHASGDSLTGPKDNDEINDHE